MDAQPSPSRVRQYIGLGVVAVAYIGGLIGWTWATLAL